MRNDFSGVNRLIEQFRMIPPGSRVLCAVSGGADSVYLLHRLYYLRYWFDFELCAAHYNHNLRGAESHRDEAFVRDFVRGHCAEMHISGGPGGEKTLPPVELAVGSGEVAREARRRGCGIEETARSMRYAFLEAAAAQLGCDRIATAHNAADNAETVLLHLLRGAGLHGLTGIAPVRGKLIRPLLTTQRKDIEEYLRLYSLPHVEDSTNADDAYSRNKVRHQVIPLLEEMNPWFVERMADTISYLRDDDDHLRHQARAVAAQALPVRGELHLPAACIAAEPGPIAVRAVSLLLERLDAWQFSAAHLTAVVRLCASADPSATVDLPHGLLARRVYDLLVLGPRPPTAAAPTLPIDPGKTWSAEGGPWRVSGRPGTAPGAHPEDLNHVFLSAARLKPPLVLRPRRTGDTITLPRRDRKTIKKLMIDAKVPRLERESIPLLCDESGPLFLPGFGPDTAHLAAPGEDAVELWAEKRETE